MTNATPTGPVLPPVIWYKAQRVLRTLLTTAVTILPLIPQVILIIQGQWEAQWLTAVGVQALAINSALTGIISLPTVNAWLTRIGLGAVPKRALVPAEVAADGVHVITSVKPDMKALEQQRDQARP